MTARSSERLRRALEKRVDSLIDTAASADHPAPHPDDVAQMELYARLLDLERKMRSTDRWLAVGVALGCVTIASILWATPLRSSNVSINVLSQTVRGRLAHDWDLRSPFAGALVHVEHLSSVQAPNLGLSTDDGSGDVWFKIEGGRAVLQSIHIREGASFELSASSDSATIFLNRGVFDGRITLIGKGVVSSGPRSGVATIHQAFDVSIPETIEFGVTTAQTVPASLTIHTKDDWALGSAAMENIGFLTESDRTPGASVMASTIKSGSLRFMDVNWAPITLNENDVLSLEGAGASRTDMSIRQHGVHVTVNGPVNKVVMGEVQAARQIAPSYLEYFYGRQTLAFFWGFVMFLWGVLWGIRKTLFA